MSKLLMDRQALEDLHRCWEQSPHPSVKITSYFPIYVQLFSHLRGTACTFIETGILDGGSLFMWRRWLGDKARIIGIDLNPEATKWREHGFEIYIGDQGDPTFWLETLPKIGQIDGFLDDGGHQSFQQIATVVALLEHCKEDCVVAVEDTYCSFMNDFASHGRHSFLEFSKAATDCIVGRSFPMYPNRFPSAHNARSIQQFVNLFSLQFYNGIVAFQISLSASVPARIVRNSDERHATDFRYAGKNSAAIEWPDILEPRTVIVNGGA